MNEVMPCVGVPGWDLLTWVLQLLAGCWLNGEVLWTGVPLTGGGNIFQRPSVPKEQTPLDEKALDS